MRQKEFAAASVLIILLTMTASYAVAGIYKLVDENGHVTYTNTPAKKGQKLQAGASQPKAVAKAPMPASLPIRNFPKVSEGQQKQRDVNRRQILESELATETKLLAEIQHALNKAIENLRLVMADPVPLLPDAHTFQDENIKKLRHQATLHERNIMALRTELESF
ncbi:DUF4124 domain-containing protein [Nitrosomonas communis]|uniref:DUF4124 domain-containing protein n=1 Tax=Nitrosomonas communis TaxID=44574 RepID=UPI0026F05E8A|nr:DUF4124 domain-containing protein [Nitrosomonas communis]MCO6428122.1 DUF4124 domain-containing protein [Nitrosomonas communis]